LRLIDGKGGEKVLDDGKMNEMISFYFFDGFCFVCVRL
jgi:hypothetical protein